MAGAFHSLDGFSKLDHLVGAAACDCHFLLGIEKQAKDTDGDSPDRRSPAQDLAPVDWHEVFKQFDKYVEETQWGKYPPSDLDKDWVVDELQPIVVLS